ncbi:MAG: hypothetical protein V3U74_03370 [Thermodesulfobacteriota bacterium]
MTGERITEGWSRALSLYETTKTLSVVEHSYTNGRERNTFVSREHGFRISWPNGWGVNWSLNGFYKRQVALGGSVDMPLVLIPDSLCGGFRPAVVVATEVGVNIDIETYISRHIRSGEDDLVEVIRSIGADLGSVLHFFHLRPFKGPSHERVFSIHKLVLTRDKAYIVTAMHIAENALVRNDKLKSDLEAILNSFSVVNF